MLRHIGGCSIAIILFLRIIEGSPISLTKLNAQHSEDTVRQTKSDQMRKFLNESADPCEDFYEFTCGNYAKYNPPTHTMNYYDSLQTAMYARIKKEMDEDKPADSDVVKKVKNFYRSCLSLPNQMDGYKDQLREAIKEFGQMPILEGDNWQESDFDWTTTISQMTYKTGLNILFEIVVDNDNSINRVTFYQAPFALAGRSLYVDAENLNERENYKTEVANNLQTFLGVAKKLAEQTAQEILDFEIALAYGMDDGKTEVYSLEHIEEVQRKYLAVWDTKKLIDDAMGFTPSSLLVQQKYLENAYKVLGNSNKKTVANYIYYDYLSYFMYDPEETPSERKQFCLSTTKNLFYENLMNFIYRKHYSELVKEGVLSMWQELKASFEKTLLSPRLRWLQEDNRKYALKKLKAMKLEILYYEQTNLSLEFSELDLNNHDYVGNLNKIRSLIGKKARAKFYEAPRQDRRDYVAYSFAENSVKIPLYVLEPFYAWSSSYPNAYNFANLGFDLAHEIIHGFDRRGRSYDAQSNIYDWWGPHTQNEFLQRQKCFVDQYKSMYSHGGRTLSEMPGQDENMADNGGVRLSFEAYLQWYEKHVGQDETQAEAFPEMNYTNRQLFFISYGQVWCSASPTDQSAGDVHVPQKFRVLGPLSNFEEFAKEFNCPQGSVMNPLKKCEMY